MLEEGDLLRILDDEYSAAESYYETAAWPEREKAYDYYLRRPRGDERQGRSRVIASEVFKTVEGITTAITNLFVNEDSPVEFVPRAQGDEEKADIRTKAVLYYIDAQANGFNAMTQAIKDGILSKTGYLTWRWEKKKTLRQEKYKNQTDQSIALILDNRDAQVVQREPGEPIESQDEMGNPVMQPTFNIVCNITESVGKVVLEAIPPEEILVSPRARSSLIEDAPVVIWRTMRTKDELLMEGYDPELVESLGYANTQTSELTSREKDYALDWTEQVEVRTFWLYVDQDQDGVFEYRKIVRCEDQIIQNEIADELPIASWCPTPMTHEFYGRCPADEAIEAQDVQTTLWRQSLDKLYRSNNPIIRASNQTVLEQLMKPEIGRPYLAKDGDMQVYAMPADNGESLQMIEFSKADNENTTGFTRYAQGMDAKSLNQTATGVKIITNMSQERVKKMARRFGHCWARACRGVSKLLSQNCDKALDMRLSDTYVQVDPREWIEQYDMTVKVGLGIPDKQERIQSAISMSQLQQQLAQITGGKVVTEKNLYNGAMRQLQALGEKSPMLLLTDPDTVEKEESMPPDPMQDPAIIKTQMEIEADAQATKYKIDVESETKRYEAELKARTQLALQVMTNQSEANRYQQEAGNQQFVDNTAAAQIAAIQEAILVGMQQNQQVMLPTMEQTRQALDVLAQIHAGQLERQSRPMTATLPNGKSITLT